MTSHLFKVQHLNFPGCFFSHADVGTRSVVSLASPLRLTALSGDLSLDGEWRPMADEEPNSWLLQTKEVDNFLIKTKKTIKTFKKAKLAKVTFRTCHVTPFWTKLKIEHGFVDDIFLLQFPATSVSCFLSFSEAGNGSNPEDVSRTTWHKTLVVAYRNLSYPGRLGTPYNL